MEENNRVIPVDLNKEMKKSYIDYAMSVIVGRALPDARDGLKVVHRRILYTMYEDGFTSDKPYKKCATTVGDVLGRYHPHGDASVYDALVRMAQDFSLRYPLIDGHGNFGSIDGDPPAAYRYTEARMSKLSQEMLTDIEKNTVDFGPNFDESLKEPLVLPSRFPNLLVNGVSGIAVGMATNIPSHNLSEVIDACIALIDNSEISIEELMNYVKGPDFPSSGLIIGSRGIRSAYLTGRGKIKIRARTEIEEHGNRQSIIVTEIPYQVNKTRLIESIADLVKNKVIEGISDLTDESGRDGMRIVIDLKREANANVILNQLYKHTQLQDTFSIIMLALVDNQPKVLNLKEILECYIKHQEEVVVRRTKFDLKKAEDRIHIVEGLRLAIDNIDEIINIIRSSENISIAKNRLSERFSLSDIQAQSIVEMRIGRLTGLEREKLEAEFNELTEKIKYFKSLLADEGLVKNVIKDELTVIKEKYGDERKTEIAPAEDDFEDEDLIPEEESIITLTQFGYIKRVSADTYKTQRRGGRGISGMSTREEDVATEILVASTHDYILFFTNKGRVYQMKAYRIPIAGRQAKGTAIVNLLEMDPDEKISAVIPVKKFEEDKYLMMVTKKGIVKKTDLLKYSSGRKSGLNAIKLDEDDELICVRMTNSNSEILIGTHDGMSIRFHEKDVRPMGRDTRGVKGIELRKGDYVVGMALADGKDYLMTVTENGMGKKSPIEDYRLQSRGGLGIKNYNITEKTGKILGINTITDEDDLMMITVEGTVIKMHTDEIRPCGRVAQGVILMRTDDNTKVAAMAIMEREEETEENEE